MDVLDGFGHGVRAADAVRQTIYTPAQRPGFAAWATAFAYGDGRIGLSFKETVRGRDPQYRPPRLELGEAVGAPVSYCSVECGSENECSYRVYLVSSDGGQTFSETGRCLLQEGSFLNMGLPDGTIIGYDVPRLNEDGTGWCDHIRVRSSADGGATWTDRGCLLEGTAPYLWRLRTLRDGTILLLLSLYGTPWGEGRQRATRNTVLPGETALNRIQTCFLTSRDGLHFTGPHYVLPGIGAHEYDVAECPDGRLLFLAGDVQGTPVGRQFVTRQGEGFLNGPLLPVRRGAPDDPARDPQGGFVPESVAMLPGGLLVGSRRNKPYTASNDFGENWFEIDGLPPSLYQPFLIALPDGTVLNFGHQGGDNAFGQVDMCIGADRFRVENRLPASSTLTLARCMDEGRTRYLNAYTARLSAAGAPVSGATVRFRAAPFWRADGTVDGAPLDGAPQQVEAVTDENGFARAAFPAFDGIPDIHFYYNVDVVYRPQHGGHLPCDGPMMCEAALTPVRRCRYPYDAYLAGGTLYLSPALLARFPDGPALLAPLCGRADVPEGALPDGLVQALLATGVLRRGADGLRWYASVHASAPLAGVQPMGSGDWYE